MMAADREPGLSVRVKLTLTYAGFLLVAGVVMLAVAVFVTARFVPDGNLTLLDGSWIPNRSNLLQVIYKYSGWAIAGLLAFGLAGGWVLAGIVLRPLRRITDAARRARDGDWDGRIALPGRRDELTDLADTFDALLDRVQRTIATERRFAANASHELRTPLTIVRTLVEVAQARGDDGDVVRTLARIGETNDRAIALTEAMLALARAESGRGLQREDVDLAQIARAVVAEAGDEALAHGIRIDTDLRPAHATADAALAARLADNLVRNAVRHNVPGGRVLVSTVGTSDHAALAVVNTGAEIAPEVVATLVEPFVRGAGRVTRASGPTGSGLGLALVDAIVRTHAGELQVSPRDGGGLQVRALLPR